MAFITKLHVFEKFWLQISMDRRPSPSSHRNAQELCRQRLFHRGADGRAGPVVQALSGIDIALWDIRGKMAGAPVSALLGGAKRTRIEANASLLQYRGKLGTSSEECRVHIDQEIDKWTKIIMEGNVRPE
jgi:L-alanine-DL-glutamate epimerase-like enolase superfamily enzyme